MNMNEWMKPITSQLCVLSSLYTFFPMRYEVHVDLGGLHTESVADKLQIQKWS